MHIWRKLCRVVTVSAVGFFVLTSQIQAATVETVKVKVLDNSGNPLVGMSAQLVDSTGVPSYFGVSDTSGIISFFGVTEATFTLKLDASMSYGCSTCSLYKSKTDTVTIAANQATNGTQDLGSYSMELASRILQVTLKEENSGQGVAGIFINAWSQNASAWGSCTTDSTGKCGFAIAEDDTSLWGISSYDQQGKYTQTFADGITVAATGVTNVDLIVAATNATAVVILKDAAGNAFSTPSDTYGSVNCFNQENNKYFFWANIEPGKSQVNVPLVAGTYRCDAWIQGYASNGAEITLAVDESKEAVITILERNAKAVVTLVDAKGNKVSDVSSFQIFAQENVENQASKDAEHKFFGGGDFSFASGTNGQGTLDLISGKRYLVGINLNTGHKSDGSHGDDGQNKPDDKQSKATSEKQYIYSFEMHKVTADEAQQQKINIEVLEADSTLKVTVKDAAGNLTNNNAWVDAGDGAKREAGEWGLWSGASVDENGVATIPVVGGKTYQVHAFLYDTFHSKNGSLPPPTQQVTINKNETKKVSLQALKSDWSVNLNVRFEEGNDNDLGTPFCYAFAPELGVDTFTDLGDQAGGEIHLTKGYTWWIGCMTHGNDKIYRSADIKYTPGNKTTKADDTLEIVLKELNDYFEADYQFPGNVEQELQFDDGATLNIPAGAIEDTASNVHLTMKTEFPKISNEENYPAKAYNFEARDSNGNIVETLNSNATLTVPYDKEELKKNDIGKKDLRGGSFDDDNNRWDRPVATEHNSKEQKVVMTINHFSYYGIVGQQQRVVAATAKPQQPRKLKVRTVTNTSALLDWKKPKQSKVKRYVVELRQQQADKTTWERWKSIKKTQKKAPNLLTNTAYQFRVKACNKNGCSDMTRWKGFTTK